MSPKYNINVAIERRWGMQSFLVFVAPFANFLLVDATNALANANPS
jgi:hypothetical protein